MTEVEEGLNIVKEALKIGEKHDEYSAYSSSEWEKVDKGHKLCKNLLVENNKKIHDVDNQLRLLQEQLHKEKHWSSSTSVPKDRT